MIVMADMSFQLEHVNIPSRDPEGMARWYADKFGLRADRHLARGPGALIAFVEGEPLNRAPEIHVGFRVPSLTALSEWAIRCGAQIKEGEEFNSFQVFDPEGNCVEIYCKGKV
jgi:catechol 2,3-dioxygenase-like lactoylglutathione lyase family enzyme